MAKVNKVTTNGTTYELQDYELNTKLSGFSGVVKNAAGTLSQAVAGTDYDYPVLKGTSAPSTSTKGSVGQRYVNTRARTSNGLAVEYVCVAAGSTYTWVSAGSAGASLSVIADSYSASSTYAIGDVVIYNGGLYKCTTTISSAEAWTSSHWSATTVDGLISNLQTTIATKVDKTTTVNGKALSSNITLSSTDIKMADNTTIEASMTSLKTSVSEGKALIAAAVTDKGVSTAADATFATMANNITSISPVFSSDIGYMYYTKTERTIGTNREGQEIYGFNGLDRISEISVTFLNSSWAFEDDKISDFKYPYSNMNNHLTFYLTKPMTYTIPDSLNKIGGSITGQLSIGSNDYDILLTTSTGNGANYTMSNESGGQAVLIILYY